MSEEIQKSADPDVLTIDPDGDGMNDLPGGNDMDDLPDGDRQLTTESDALDEGGSNDSDLGADVAGDIGPKHD